MSTNIVTKLLNSNPPRRFLEKSDETGNAWQEVPLKRAVTKTSQALRDVARDRAKAAAAAAAAAANKGGEGAGGAVAAVKSSSTTSSTTTSFNKSFKNGSSNENNGFATAAGMMPSHHHNLHLPAQNLPPASAAAAYVQRKPAFRAASPSPRRSLPKLAPDRAASRRPSFHGRRRRPAHDLV